MADEAKGTDEIGTTPDAARDAAAATTAQKQLQITATAFAAKAKDLAALRDAVVEAAGVGAGLWLSYLFVFFYLAIAAGGVTHRDLFFENPIKLPFLNVELPLIGFFVLGPLLFLIVHAYVLLHFVLLGGKVGVFHAELQKQIKDEDVRAGLRRQLPSNIFVQFLAGPLEVRRGVMGFLLRSIAQITLVAAPIALLVLFQLQFLPYHHEGTTWWHRIAVVADLVVLWTLWPSVARGEMTWIALRDFRRVKVIVLTLVSLIPVFLVITIATFPGESLNQNALSSARWIPQIDRRGAASNWTVTSLNKLLFFGEVNQITGKRNSLWSSTLVLPGERFVDDEKLDKQERTVLLRGRDLRGAVLMNADLRKADFTGANLSEARLDGGKFDNAVFGCAETGKLPYEFRADDMPPFPVKHGWPEDGCTWLQGASFENSELRSASFFAARLQAASFTGAQLQGADFYEAELQGASFSSAELQGARLENAHVQAASFISAQLQGTSFTNADMRGAALARAESQAASFDSANLQGAWLNNTRLQAADLGSADLWLASLTYADVWRTQGTPRSLKLTRVDGLDRSRRPFADGEFTSWYIGIRDKLRGKFIKYTSDKLSLLDPDKPDPQADEVWTKAIAKNPTFIDYSKELAKFLMELACSEKDAPWVARGLIRNSRFVPRQLDEIAATFKKADKQNCPGAIGLTSDDFSRLDELIKRSSRASRPRSSRAFSPAEIGAENETAFRQTVVDRDRINEIKLIVR